VKRKVFGVSLPAGRVGTLAQERSGAIEWTPDVAWEQGGQLPRLGLEFLRRPGPRVHHSELPAWFENLLPERGSELRSRLAEAQGLREGQSFALLGAVGRDLIGAVEVDAGGAPLGVEDADAGSPGAPSPDGARPMSALTGMQLKFSMSMVNERLVLSACHGRTAYIVKIPGRDYDGLAEVEAATMTWARHAGFAVPEHFVVSFDRLDGIPEGWVAGSPVVFAVRRFDRREDGSRIHQEDLCQALELRPLDKYGNRAVHVTFEGALRLVTSACGEPDGREMARRLGFMIASGNSDAHLKNWSLVWGDRTRPTLSAAYDLVATVTWESLGWRRRGGPELALRLGGERAFRNIDRDVVRAFGKATAPWAEDELLAGIERARAAFPEIAGSVPAAMRAALDEHWRAVPLLDAAGALGTAVAPARKQE
jgi:serine/threonine-protein kinase HipA